jgi:hypothetical protein
MPINEKLITILNSIVTVRATVTSRGTVVMSTVVEGPLRFNDRGRYFVNSENSSVSFLPDSVTSVVGTHIEVRYSW